MLEHLSEFAIFDKLGKEDCPLFFPILLPEDKRDDLRAFLIERKIYCPIHWPLSKKHLIGKREESLYNQELSLLCEQRYGLEDIEKIVKAVKTFFKR